MAPIVRPTLADFTDVLERLAHTLHDDSDPERDAWIRGSISSAGTKLRALTFVLSRYASAGAPALLDVGAQIGSLAIYARRLGMSVAAIDLPHFTAKFARASVDLGVDYRACDVTIDQFPFSEAAFDAVTYLDVIEHHQHSPKRVLAEIHRVLKPGGCVIITTPNQASIYNRARLLLGGSVADPFDYFFETASGMTPYPGHHREYVRAELRAALTRSGFRVMECLAIDEDLRPQLALARSGKNGSSAIGVWQHKKEIVPAALGKFFSAVRLPFGRVLWAVGLRDS